MSDFLTLAYLDAFVSWQNTNCSVNTLWMGPFNILVKVALLCHRKIEKIQQKFCKNKAKTTITQHSPKLEKYFSSFNKFYIYFLLIKFENKKTEIISQSFLSELVHETYPANSTNRITQKASTKKNFKYH